MPTSISSTRTKASELASSIRRDIITGAFDPDVNLRIRDLSERYGAGAIPVREALSRLVASGFVVAEDQRGFRVASVSEAELNDITRTRVFLEDKALRLAIANADLDWEQRLISISYRLSRLPMYDDSGSLSEDWEQAHEAFHAALLSGCGSRYLQQLACELRDLTARYRHLSSIGTLEAEMTDDQTSAATVTGAAADHKPRDVTREHEDLCAAAIARDADRACDLLSKHYWATANLVLSNRIGPTVEVALP